MTETVKKLISAGKEIYIAEDIPTFSFDPQKCKFESRLYAISNKCDEDIDHFNLQEKSYLPILHSLKKTFPSIKIVNFSKYFCNANKCSMQRDGRILYRDSDHLNIDGSSFLANQIVKEHPGLLMLNEED